MLAALRVLSTLTTGSLPLAHDVDLVKINSRPDEQDLDLDNIAERIIKRSFGLTSRGFR